MCTLQQEPRNSNQSTTQGDMFSHIHRVCGHMSDAYIKWHRENSKNAKFSDADAKTDRLRPLCKACVYGEDRQTSTDRHRIHRPLPTLEGQCFAVDVFACGHTSHRGFKYCDVMRDGASQIYKESGSRGDSKCVYQRSEERRVGKEC